MIQSKNKGGKKSPLLSNILMYFPTFFLQPLPSLFRHWELPLCEINSYLPHVCGNMQCLSC